MPKTKEVIKSFMDALEEAGFEPEPYSGRGMYGKRCICVKNVSDWEIARALPEDLNIPTPHSDALGLGTVLYWPPYIWPEDNSTM